MNGRIILAAALFAVAPVTPGIAKDKVTAAADFEKFSTEFCRANRRHGHIFVVPLQGLIGKTGVDCDYGMFSLQMTEPANDKGHYVITISPPAGVEDGLDCDGKADQGMERVALNCLPSNMVAASHSN